MQWLPRLKIRRRFHSASRDELLGLGEAFDERARGSVIHAAMDALQPTGEGPGDEAAVARAVDAALASAQRLPDTPEETSALRGQARDCLAWALSVPGLRHWLRTGLAEQPILDDQCREHRPDLLVLDRETTLIVEYKTGRQDPEHVAQVRRYLGLLEAMGRPRAGLRGVLVYLDLRLTREVRLDEVAS